MIGDLFGPNRYQVPHGFSQCIAGPFSIAIPPLIGLFLDNQQAMTGTASCHARNFHRFMHFAFTFSTHCPLMIQLNPALTDFMGPTNLICYRRNSVIVKIRKIKENRYKGPKISICYRRNSVKSGVLLCLINLFIFSLVEIVTTES